jgi:HK97 family phage prohead protease
MPMKLLSADDFRSAAKDGQKPDATVFRFATTEPQTVGAEDDRTIRFVFSDATVDHAGDSIDPKGWDLGVFKRNPVALFSHMSWEPPIGRAGNVAVEGGKLMGDIAFADAETYEFADTIYRLVKGKFMNAVSVGFKPVKWAFTNDKDRPYGIDFIKSLLLEISVCPVPCNPNALGEARSLGIDTRSLVDWAEKVLDNGDTVFMPRKDLEALRLQAKDAPAPRYYVQHDGVLTQEQAERVKSLVKQWAADPSEVLVLPASLTLRTVGERSEAAVEDQLAEVGAIDDKNLEALLLKIDSTEIRAAIEVALKAGRKISAATRAKLQDALDHHDASAKCIKEVMAADEDDDEPDDDSGDQELTPEPEGSDVPDDMSPEERRVKEARALKAGLPPIN